jgi:cystathionine beta-lyase/cystathionine gamma-synthase
MSSNESGPAARNELRAHATRPTHETAPGSDRSDLILEVSDMASQELAKLTHYATLVSEELTLLAGSQRALKGVFDCVISDIKSAAQVWLSVNEYVSNLENQDDEVFVNVMALCGHAIRKSAAARTALVRHTPTLRGSPRGLDPRQSQAEGGQTHTVDYLRGGYILFQEPITDPPSRYADHPSLNVETTNIVTSLYPSALANKSLAFTCGISALDAVMDVMAAKSLRSGKVNMLGRNCWIELRRRMEIRDPRHFELYNDNDPSSAAELLLHPDVQSVWIEGIQNHPEMRVVNLHALRNSALQLPEDSDKYLIVDNVATFDSDVFSLFDDPFLRSRISVMCAVSMIKFFQNGTDSAKAGLLALQLSDFSSRTYMELIEARAGSGKSPAYEELLACGSDTVTSLNGRMRRYDQNNNYMAQRLSRFANERGLVVVSSPWLLGHPDHRLAMALHGHGGRFVYLRPARAEQNFDVRWLELYRALADGAASCEVPLIAASTFGFAIPHIHIVRHQGYGLSIRLSAGSVHSGLVERFVEYVERTISQFLTGIGSAESSSQE